MNIGAGRRALWQALRTSTSGGGGSGGGVLPSAISGLSGWWDASDPLTSLDPGGQPILGWNSLVASLLDKSAHGVPLTLCSFANTAGLPAATPRLSGLLGGLGRVAGGASTSCSSAGSGSRLSGPQCFPWGQLELDSLPGLVTPKLEAKFGP